MREKGFTLREKGFTLIELLVVIAIIALLLSVIVPSLRKVKETAKATLCLNNQRQIGLFLAMYAEDNDNEVIELFNWVPGWQNVQQTVPLRWADRMFYELQYTDSSEMFYCPQSRVPRGISKKWPSEYSLHPVAGGVFDDSNGTYTYGLRPKDFTQTYTEPIKLYELKSPSSFFLLSDISEELVVPTSSRYYHEVDGSHYYMFDAWHSFFMVHRKGANIVTADMGVARHKLEDIVRAIARQGDMSFVGAAFVYPDGTLLNVNGNEIP